MISNIDIEDMTDAQDELDKALALIRENSAAPSVPWTGEEFTHTLMPDDMCAAVATILNAAVSGDLARPSQAGDRQRVQAMHDSNWKPAVTYWRERAEKAEAASQAGDERVARALEAVTSDLFYQIESKHGPKVASEYPSIVRARAALAAMDTPKGGGDE